MKFRPWPIIILAAVHLLAPLLNILYSAWLMHAGVQIYLVQNFGHDQWEHSLSFFFAFPIAGIAIYRTNRWSYPTFLLVMAWALYSNFLTWLQFPQYFGLTALIFSYAINLAVVSYFLIPAVRSVYFNPRLRWWEAEPRYDVLLRASLWDGGYATIINIAEGGIFAETEVHLDPGEEVEVSFSNGGKEYHLDAEVLRVREARFRGYGGYAFRFIHTPTTARRMKRLIYELKVAGAHERTGDVQGLGEFKNWFVTTLKTGHGIIPELPPESTQLPDENGAVQ